jgi:hypothetical protein
MKEKKDIHPAFSFQMCSGKYTTSKDLKERSISHPKQAF